MSSSSKLPPGTEPPLITSRTPPRSRSEKVIVALEGDDEFSIASVDPDHGKPAVELDPKGGPSTTEATGDRRTVWRLFRKIFS